MEKRRTEGLGASNGKILGHEIRRRTLYINAGVIPCNSPLNEAWQDAISWCSGF